MVVVHVKKTDIDQFLFETSTSESNDTLIRELVAIWNMRLRLQRLTSAALELAKHGPQKPEAERGLDETKEGAEERGPHFNPDPTGYRTGDAPAPSAAATLTKTCEEAQAAIHKNQVARKVALTMSMLTEHLELIRGAVTICYPMGLPDHEIVRMELEGSAEPVGTQSTADVLDPDTAQLWWAGKEFHRDETVGDRVGRNEKTKIIGKLQKRGGGAPVREPAVSEEERRAMMAHYFKKQEELKKLAEDDDDEFHGAAWADGTTLKRELLGTSSVRMPGGR
uniref:Uncharacterized protein n=1 Tax=Bicosoecida sp. CB-2014 TaxID=1486930 RepID=A0A7S1CTE9_9STRA|mmetsp:Transcript_9533/g.33502  ORF Transcript_9533/g.33502 Transcript_9533/m.33502 type:complete len:280 (+) Transcript_9533:197-1036(+)|eukprot:CAMPEP_0203813484 /NCGR_PEP_ID=MMETSP0115-20131106/4740_1 /ASSEMBLY_ACC=CAM_ASM_000227 /TAXON_ID=33651 /ORGANISM="Bicosoecid sp, Strain ms1" /LENGTH=279 /DNA_ID=CAMNT_0050722351 /DNA_START=197 /DNA_END=1036 /DNA_ORIENTATION=+